MPATPAPPPARVLPASRPSASARPGGLLRTFHQHRYLIGQLTRREVLNRYRGSYLGVLWSFLNPLFMLAIFGTVFGLIFKAKFTGHAHETPIDYALQLFAGLIVFNALAEAISRSPTLLLSNSNYVTKVVFPLEVLPVIIVLNSLINLCLSLLALALGVALLHAGSLPATFLLWPLLLLPLFFLGLGISWLMTALGVFFRDLNELVGPIINILMYASALFYPLTSVPPHLQVFLRLNPLVFLARQSRDLAIWGDVMDWQSYGLTLVGTFVFALVGYTVFMRLKPAFADVL